MKNGKILNIDIYLYEGDDRMKISGVIFDDIANGDGLRTTIFISGCKHKCKGCQNMETWDFDKGIEFDKDTENKIYVIISGNSLIRGITLSGGDPMYSAKDLIPFVTRFKDKFPNKDIWLYTGFKWKEILEDEEMTKLAKLCDVIVDEPFILEERDITLPFRGSKNQHIIDCKESFKQKRLVEKEVD